MTEVEWIKCKAHELRQQALDDAIVVIPTRASAEKGERLLGTAAEGLAKLMLAPETWIEAKDLRQAETGGVPLKD